MNKFIEALSTWKGRKMVQDEIKDRGFGVPQAYQQIVINFCGNDKASELEHYWDDWAKELVCAGGKVHSNLRVFHGDYSFRSKYLDQLASVFDYKKVLPIVNPDIHPCLFEFNLKQTRESQLLIAEKMKDIQHAEIQHFKLTAKGWSGLKKDIAPIFKRFLSERGFISKGKISYKNHPSGLVFKCWVDTGGIPEVLGLPLEFTVNHKSFLETDTFHIHFDYIIPGIRFYSGCQTPQLAILGIYAYAEVFNAFVNSFA